jgi:glutaredoxin
LVERSSSSGRDARSEARTQGASIAKAIGATEDAASGRVARPDGTDSASPSPPQAGVAFYRARGCHLCERAGERLEELRRELGFEVEEIWIDGDPELEARYRELIPVVEIDGERVCTYYVQPEPFRRKLAAAQAAPSEPGL